VVRRGRHAAGVFFAAGYDHGAENNLTRTIKHPDQIAAG
jgi:hypothetical protein